MDKSPAKSVTEARIVEAAAQLFARNGFKAATTREIAQLADLNEVTLFRYFPRKSDLFWAAMDSRLGRVKLHRDLQICLTSNTFPAIVIPKLVAFLLNSLAQQPDLYRLLHVAACELPGGEKIIREHLGPILDMVNSYFQRCFDKGMTQVTASIATLGLLGTVSAHYYLRRFITGEELSSSSFEEEAASCSEVWLRALGQNGGEKNHAMIAPKRSISRVRLAETIRT